MATATVARRDLKVKDQTFLWEGVDRNNKPMRGEMRAVSETVATTLPLRRVGWLLYPTLLSTPFTIAVLLYV